MLFGLLELTTPLSPELLETISLPISLAELFFLESEPFREDALLLLQDEAISADPFRRLTCRGVPGGVEF
ncbi:hypothetical protein DYB25_009982 [Aphanomyces astaci]|uniref:Uncharacterized protein n=1 Tax=Aphanomyces astaci TaxID=112090 RepID=A0A397CM47_APHAT|nr:hypothetical protein DYB25_009982 [Aphanomyces astaci]RHY12452.1 hypothetical protein DYB36_009323 [Aphanomyces astaci]RHY49135.1 hypothetical protein DYB38_009820 [Aphanomyces astaci]RHY54285.1 hypothetical protein DYB30_009245 [Aphanomyces astaci]RHY69917.1 hypothetical protein DYB34_010547 [Aphanomyces astaci]